MTVNRPLGSRAAHDGKAAIGSRAAHDDNLLQIGQNSTVLFCIHLCYQPKVIVI